MKSDPALAYFVPWLILFIGALAVRGELALYELYGLGPLYVVLLLAGAAEFGLLYCVLKG